MRAMMTAGSALARDEIAGFNCSFVAVDDVRAFDEILYVLMCGTGVGFSVESKFVSKLPVIAEEFHPTDTTIVVKDSKIGWASAFRELISLLYAGLAPKWDISKVRPAGAKLKTFGGRASGPDPLIGLFMFTMNVFHKAAGRKLTSLECHDIICKVADIVIAGGVRRSALISLSDLSDDRIRGAKSGQWWADNSQRALANNSAVYTERPDIEKFIAEWHSLIQSKSGERGIFNRASTEKKAAETGRRDPNHEWGTNPCITADMRILTSEGYVAIGSVIDQEISIWNGYTYSAVVPFSTGINPIMEVLFSNGAKLKVTPYHKFILADGSRVQANNLRLGAKLAKHALPQCADKAAINNIAYSQGFYSGDGTKNNTRSWLYAPKYACGSRLIGSIRQDGDGTRARKAWIHGPMLPKNFVPSAQIHGLTYFISWIAGLMDADGTVVYNPNSSSLQLGSIDSDFLNEVRVQLSAIGIFSKVTAEGRENRAFDGYVCQPFYRLHVGAMGVQTIHELGASFLRLTFLSVEPDRDASRFVTVLGVRDLEYSEETFCLTEPINHSMIVEGVFTAQCGEIILRSAGLCNLTEVIVRAGDDLEELKEKVEIATILGTFQATLSKFRYVRAIWSKNQEEERLLGVSMTGIMDHEILSSVGDVAGDWLNRLKLHAIAVNKEWAEKLGINPAASITTVKPSGTVSQLVDSASGIHPRFSKTYLRTIRGDKKDPLLQFMRYQGFHVEDCVINPRNTDVLSFPVRSPDYAVLRDEMTAVEQLEHYSMFRKHWCEHNPSITVYVRDHEWLAVGDWVYRNFDEIGGVSFLPHTDHIYRQAPYTECTEAQFQVANNNMPKLDWAELQNFETEDSVITTKELACSAGVCEI
jgi:hypothetical protein